MRSFALPVRWQLAAALPNYDQETDLPVQRERCYATVRQDKLLGIIDYPQQIRSLSNNPYYPASDLIATYTEKMMLIYNVFGRHIGVKREHGRWLVFRIDLSERKYSLLKDITIPDELTETELPGWLDDIYHEEATENNPSVKRIE